MLLVLLVSTTCGAYDFECDQNQDGKLTAGDALIVLRKSVDQCKTNYECGPGGGFPSSSGALAMLRHSVGVPESLDCSCVYIHECFAENHCTEYWGADYACIDFLCMQCSLWVPCDPGYYCDPCRMECLPEER